MPKQEVSTEELKKAFETIRNYLYYHATDQQYDRYMEKVHEMQRELLGRL